MQLRHLRPGARDIVAMRPALQAPWQRSAATAARRSDGTRWRKVLVRQLEGRRPEGPLFLGHQTQERLGRRADLIDGAVGRRRRAGAWPPRVRRETLTRTHCRRSLCSGATAIEGSRAPWGYRTVVTLSVGWESATDPSEDNASVRLARFVLTPPETSEAMLMHAEALVSGIRPARAIWRDGGRSRR